MSGHRSFEELESKIQAVSERHPIDTEYQHYKGDIYKVVGYGVLEATDEVAVAYVNPSHPEVPFYRAISFWEEDVDVDGAKVPRYSRID